MDSVMQFLFTSLMLFLGAFIWLTPMVLITRSRRTSGGEKVAWLLAMFFISWFAWLVYLLLAPVKPKPGKAIAHH